MTLEGKIPQEKSMYLLKEGSYNILQLVLEKNIVSY